MSRSLELIVRSLLPTYPPSALPQPLLDISSSLLAQSQLTTLKAEEEIARSYACAHIACDRLKISLDLPQIQARPPVRPAVYKKLYQHLDKNLPATTRRTPRKDRCTNVSVYGSAVSVRTGERPTPSKEATLAQFRSWTETAGKATPGRTSKKRKSRDADELPVWVRPVIKSVCTQLDGLWFGRNVVAGIQTMAFPHGKRSTDAWVNEHFTPLLASVYFVLATKVEILSTGKDIRPNKYTRLRRDVVAALVKARREVDIAEADWVEWSELKPQDVDEAVNWMVDKGWTTEEWCTSMDSLLQTRLGDRDGDIEMEDGPEEYDGDDANGVLTRKMDSMVQDEWAMTSKKLKTYHDWQDDILRRCHMLEQSNGTC